MRRAAFFVLCALGCNHNVADDVDVMAEAADASSRASSVTAVASAKAVTALFVQEDPTLDVSRTALANADAVATQLTGAVCGTATVTHAAGSATVSVDFGAGCTVPNVGFVAGAASVTISKQLSRLDLAFTFTTLSVEDKTIDGTLDMSTSDATSFSVTANLTSGSGDVMFMGYAQLDANGAGVTFGGNGMAKGVAYTASNVHHAFGGCYADAGTVTIGRVVVGRRGSLVAVTDVITFDATTPSTGVVTVTVNAVKSTVTLPPYGTCPHA
jgi:hypothetical protein